ncbi:MAG: hypothetical protein JNK82_43280 [Myxococcaceae bacterium]|nr:hypothetical protein [Myxococcaceae bacterium]
MVLPALLILTAAPTVAQAEAMASKKQWDELYLAWAAVKPDAVPEGDRARVAKALSKGCAALASSDAVMAQSLGEKAVQLAEDADAMLCSAKAAVKNDQRTEAEAMLRTGRKHFADDDRFALELGRMLLSENDSAGALKELQAIGPKSKLKKEATPLLKKALTMEAEAGSAKADVRATEKRLNPREVAVAERGGGSITNTGSSTYESGVDDEGRRTRGNAYFRFRYFNGQRDFGQRADYEGRVQAALEEARTASNRLLGTSRQKPTDVILYSKSEFTMHHGAQAARSVAGFYSENAIRMNDTAEINPRNQTVLVHEYVHAVLDEVAHFKAMRVPIWLNEGLATWVEWRYDGSDGPPPAVQNELRGAATHGALPSLRQMAGRALISMGNPRLAYDTSGAAVHLLLKTGGPENLLGLFDDVGGGQALEVVFNRRYGRTLAEFEEKLADELKSR